MFVFLRCDSACQKSSPRRVLILLPVTCCFVETTWSDFAQEERLDLSYWTMIWAIRVLVDESKCLDILTLEFSITLVHLPFWPASAACPAHPGSLDIISNYLCGSLLWCWWSLFSEYFVRAWIIFHNVTSEYDSAFVLRMLRLQLLILDLTKIHQGRKMNFSAFIPCFIDHLFVSDICQLPCRYFQVFPTFSPLLPLHPVFFNAGGIGVNLRTKLQWLNECIPFAAMWSSWYLCGTPSDRIFIELSASTIQAY